MLGHRTSIIGIEAFMLLAYFEFKLYSGHHNDDYGIRVSTAQVEQKTPDY
jgi:hypothetical protein